MRSGTIIFKIMGCQYTTRAVANRSGKRALCGQSRHLIQGSKLQHNFSQQSSVVRPLAPEPLSVQIVVMLLQLVVLAHADAGIEHPLPLNLNIHHTDSIIRSGFLHPHLVLRVGRGPFHDIIHE